MTSKNISTDVGTYSSAMSEDGDSAFPTKRGKEEDEAARKELDEVHEHADPSKGDKEVDGGDRVKTEAGRMEPQMRKPRRPNSRSRPNPWAQCPSGYGANC